MDGCWRLARDYSRRRRVFRPKRQDSLILNGGYHKANGVFEDRPAHY